MGNLEFEGELFVCRGDTHHAPHKVPIIMHGPHKVMYTGQDACCSAIPLMCKSYPMPTQVSLAGSEKGVRTRQ